MKFINIEKQIVNLENSYDLYNIFKIFYGYDGTVSMRRSLVSKLIYLWSKANKSWRSNEEISKEELEMTEFITNMRILVIDLDLDTREECRPIIEKEILGDKHFSDISNKYGIRIAVDIVFNFINNNNILNKRSVESYLKYRLDNNKKCTENELEFKRRMIGKLKYICNDLELREKLLDELLSNDTEYMKLSLLNDFVGGEDARNEDTQKNLMKLFKDKYYKKFDKLYHGLHITDNDYRTTIDDALSKYKGFTSCSKDLNTARTFALNGSRVGTVLELTDVFGLDIEAILEDYKDSNLIDETVKRMKQEKEVLVELGDYNRVDLATLTFDQDKYFSYHMKYKHNTDMDESTGWIERSIRPYVQNDVDITIVEPFIFHSELSLGHRNDAFDRFVEKNKDCLIITLIDTGYEIDINKTALRRLGFVDISRFKQFENQKYVDKYQLVYMNDYVKNNMELL